MMNEAEQQRLHDLESEVAYLHRIYRKQVVQICELMGFRKTGVAMPEEITDKFMRENTLALLQEISVSLQNILALLVRLDEAVRLELDDDGK